MMEEKSFCESYHVRDIMGIDDNRAVRADRASAQNLIASFSFLSLFHSRPLSLAATQLRGPAETTLFE